MGAPPLHASDLLMAWGAEAEVHGASNEADGIVLPWLVVRQDENGNRYRVGRYATRDQAQKISESLDSRGHLQLYWVERVGDRNDIVSATNTLSVGVSPSPGDQAQNIRNSPGQIPPPAEESTESARKEPTHGAEVQAGRRLQRAKLLFEALAHILPADARDRWCEEWMAEWADLGDRPLRTRVAFLVRVTLGGLPSIAWTLRLAARRQSAR
jgi:hypothetical protein